MTASEIAQAALTYREGNVMFARFDIQAALDGVPGAINRFGSDRAALQGALRILGG